MEVVHIHKVVVWSSGMGRGVVVDVMVELWFEEPSKCWLDMVWSINTVANMLVKTWLIVMVGTGIELSVWHIEVIMMDRLVMAFFELPVLVFMASWVNSLEHIMMRFLNKVGMVVMNWLREDSFMESVWIEESLLLVVHWLLQVKLLAMVRWNVVVLDR